jgi:hypothetical protein
MYMEEETRKGETSSSGENTMARTNSGISSMLMSLIKSPDSKQTDHSISSVN